MTVAGYIRVSTDRQNLEPQRDAITAWAKCIECEPESITWYEDTESGKNSDRPALQRLYKDINAGKVRTVIVWKLDRLARNQLDGVRLLGDWCKRGVRIASVTQQIDLDGLVGQMIAGLLFGLGELELQYQKERQAVGIAHARTKGLYKGRKRGTTKASQQRAYELRFQGLTALEIAKSLGVGVRTVFRYFAQAEKEQAAEVAPKRKRRYTAKKSPTKTPKAA